jgi:hypothetical protein
MGWECRTTEEKNNVYELLMGKLERRPPVRPRRRLVDNIKMDRMGWCELN